MAILFAGIAHFVNKAGRLRLATLVLLTDVVLMSGSLAFVYSGADYYLFFGGAFLVLLIGLLLMPVDWLWWQPFYLILIGIIWLGGQTSFIERFSIQSSLALRIFFPVVTIAIGLTAVLEFMRHQLAGDIQTRLLTFVAATAIISAATISSINGILTQRALTASAEQALVGAATQTATAVDTFIETNLNLINSHAGLGAFSDYMALSPDERQGSDTERQARNLLRQLARLDVTYISSYALLDLDGNDLLDTNTSDVGTNEAGRAYFQDALRLSQPHASDFEISPTSGGLNIYFSAPVRAVTGHVVGFVRVRYNVGIIQQIVYDNTGLLGDQSIPVLLDDYYIRLAEGLDNNLVLNPVVPLTQQELDTLIAAQRLPSFATIESGTNLPAFAEGLRNATEQPVFVSETHPGETTPDSVAVAPLSTKSWVVAFYQPQEVFLAPVQVQTRATIFATLLVVGGVLLIAVVVARRFSRPIIELTEAAENIMAGNLDTKVEITSQDEVGILGSSFNAMTTQLSELVGTLEHRVQQRTAALETSVEVGRRLSTILDEADLVRAVVEQVRDAFDYYHVHIYLFDEKQEKLRMAGGTGDAGQQMLDRGHSLNPGQGLVGKAAVSNTAVLVPDVEQAPDWLPNPLLPETRAEVAVPIALGEEVLGVLDVQHNLTDGLQEPDTELLRSIANQIAITLRNARLYQETQQVAEQEALINAISRKILQTDNVNLAMQVAVRELGQAVGAKQSRVYLKVRDGNGEK
ncbi:MAG: GAF domain-containing protein [Ardenticatenaceae bacterium]|nr:GAF domain-containing protein [Ardenticatenaceae bacterium]